MRPSSREFFCALAAALLAVFLAGCGSVGQPLYPALNIPTRTSNLTAIERGEKIDIRFTIPAVTTEGLGLKGVGDLELRIGPPNANMNEWAAAAQRIQAPVPTLPGSVHVEAPVRDFVGKQVWVAVRVASSKGRLSEWSNIVNLTVEQPLAKPLNFRAEGVPEGVRVSWTAAPGENAFRIFRKIPEGAEPTELATSNKPGYIDTSTEYGKTYEYYVQAIHDRTESDAAGPASITTKDEFPPLVPTGITISAGVSAIELAWERNTESDFKQYRIYRAIGDGLFAKIAEGLEAPSYSDHDVQSGTRYRYRITAEDQSGNESKPSEAVEITLP